MRIPGLKTVKQTGRWIKSRFIEHGLILGYHRIVEEPVDPYQVCVKPEFFVEQLEVLKKYACPLRLDDFVQGIKNQELPRRAVTITFDDGYVDNLYIVKPLLEEYGIPATIFITTGYMGNSFWWDRLAGWVRSIEKFEAGFNLSVNGRYFELKSAGSNGTKSREYSFSSREELLKFLYYFLWDFPDRERQEMLLELSSSLNAGPIDYQLPRILSSGEVVQLTNGGLIEVGAHTVSHPVLARLPEEDQRREVQQCKSSLEELLGVSVKGFSYPNGSSSTLTRGLVEVSGFDYACTSANGVVWSGSDPFLLPRFWVPNLNGTAFSRWLTRWLDH